jgi:hypothetical protein
VVNTLAYYNNGTDAYGLYYKYVMNVIYNRNDSGLYYKCLAALP